jgi:hypothetical protein
MLYAVLLLAGRGWHGICGMCRACDMLHVHYTVVYNNGELGASVQPVYSATCTFPLHVWLQVEFDGVKHHMAIDGDAVTSLELLAPTRSRAALQKAIASTASASGAAAAAAAVLQAALQDTPLSTQGTAASRPIAGTQGGYAAGSSTLTRSRPRASCKAAAAASCSSKGSGSLFGFLNHTATACGARLLRTNLLQPLTDITTLELRLDSLQVCGAIGICHQLLVLYQAHMPLTWHFCAQQSLLSAYSGCPTRVGSAGSCMMTWLCAWVNESMLAACRNSIHDTG